MDATQTTNAMDLTVIGTTDNCRYCLMCRHVCPVAHVTHLETLTPHGWGLTIASVRRGLLAWDEDAVGVLYHCADCGTCRAHCVTDQPLPDAIAAARAEVAAAGKAPASVYRMQALLAAWGNPYRESAPAPVTGKGEVALFVGDAARHLWPSALEAALRLLAAAGVQPVLVGDGRNSGYVASSLGLADIAVNLGRANLTDLDSSGAGRLLALTPGDYFTFTQLYQDRLGLNLPAHVEVVEVMALLAEAWEAGNLPLQRPNPNPDRQGGSSHTLPPDLPYAYLDPTHTVRVPQRAAAPRRLLDAVLPNPRRELFWRQDRAHPSGATALQFTLPHLAVMLAHARLGDARDCGAQVLFTEDPGDLFMLHRHAPAFGLQVRGLYEFLADHLYPLP